MIRDHPRACMCSSLVSLSLSRLRGDQDEVENHDRVLSPRVSSVCVGWLLFGVRAQQPQRREIEKNEKKNSVRLFTSAVNVEKPKI